MGFWADLHNGVQIVIYACELDFIKKIKEHSKFRQFLFQLVCGRYAYREYELMCLNYELEGTDLSLGYGLEDCEYHKKSIKTIRNEYFRNRDATIKQYKEDEND